MDRVPFTFVENRGQWDTPALFVARKGPITVRVERDALIVDHASPTEGDSQGLSTRFVFEGVRDDARVVGLGSQAGVRNYFLGREVAVTGVPGFRSVLYRGLYDGIDVRVRDHGGKLEYDLMLAPGADLDQVRVRCVGIDGLEVEDDGTLSMHTAVGTIHQSLPATWAELESGKRQPLACTFVKLDETRYGLRVPERDPSLPVVIDPGLEWATYLGGTGAEGILAVEAVGATGEVVVAGSTDSMNFPTTGGPYQPNLSGDFDGFVARMDPSASNNSQLVWSTYFGGSNFESISDIRLDAPGNVFGVGTTYSDNLPTTANAYEPNNLPAVDGFVLELSPNGSTLLYSTYFGGSLFDNAIDIELTPPSTVTIGGTTQSLDLPMMNAFQPTFGGGARDYYVAQLDLSQAGQAGLVYSTYLGGAGTEGRNFVTNNVVDSYLMDVTVHPPTGEIVVTGRTESSNYPTTPTTAYQAHFKGDSDAILTFLDPNQPPAQQLSYSTYIGGESWDNGLALHVDSARVATIGGITWSSNYPTTTGAFSTAFQFNANEGCVTRLDPSLFPGDQLLYSTYLAGSGQSDQIHELDVTSSGDVIAVGLTDSADFPVTCGAYDVSVNGPTDAFVTLLACDGNGVDDLQYSSFFGGNVGVDYLLAVEILSTTEPPRVVAAGLTDTTDVPTTTGAYQGTASGSFDGLVIQLELNPHLYCAANPNSVSPDGARICGEGSVVIADNNLMLSATGLPTSQFGYFLMSASQGFTPNFGGSQGNLCLGAPQFRFSQNVLNTGSSGSVAFTPDLNNLPQGVVVMPNETWYFQLWYRDNNPGTTSNTSNGLAVTFH